MAHCRGGTTLSVTQRYLRLSLIERGVCSSADCQLITTGVLTAEINYMNGGVHDIQLSMPVQ